MKDLTGQRFGRLQAQWPAGMARLHRPHWLCLCICGTLVVIEGANIRAGHSHSCGCAGSRRTIGKRSLRHGHARRGGASREYRTWQGMIKRCTNPRSKDWENYGERGIKVCARWRFSFSDFLADMGPKPIGKSIERINNDGDYEPGNCKWATRSEQNSNQRRNKK